MKTGQIIIQGALASDVVCTELEARLRELITGINSSIQEPLSVAVKWADEVRSSADWDKCGAHFFYLQPVEDEGIAHGALHVSLEAVLSTIRAARPLAFLCGMGENWGDADMAVADASGDSPKTLVASPEDEKFIREWLAEESKFDRSQWIVSEKVATQFNDAVNSVRFRDKIYHQWGFSSVDPTPRAVVCFHGPPGTGKTMGAHVIASALGKKILCANYAQVESKYVGEAPKRLRSAFLAAQQQDAVLFFDEADSFCCRRLENISSGNDQANNSLRSEMFILIENFSGVVVLATNLVTNFDPAFESRITSFVEVELPTADARRVMIRSKLPQNLPLSDDVNEAAIERMVELSAGLSGRHIRTAIQKGLVVAACHSETLGYDVVRAEDLIHAFDEVRESNDILRHKRAEKAGGMPLELSPEEESELLDIAQKKLEEKEP